MSSIYPGFTPSLPIGANTFTGGTQTFPASTTGYSSINVPAGTAPTSPNSGDIWYDSNQKVWMTFINGVKAALPLTLFTQNTKTTLVNSTVPTNILGTGIGITTLPANFWVPGKSLAIEGRGVYSTAGILPTFTVTPKLNGIQLATATISNFLVSASNAGFNFRQLITCVTNGASGTFYSDGVMQFGLSSGGLGASYLENNGTSVTIDTTVSHPITFNGAWGTASASNTISVTECNITALN